MGYSLEVDMIREAKKIGLLTTPYAHNIDEAKAMAEAGADVVVGVSSDSFFCIHRGDSMVVQRIWVSPPKAVCRPFEGSFREKDSNLTIFTAIGASSSKSLDDCVQLTQTMADTVHAVDPEIIVLVHGGPVAEPDDVQYILDRTRGVAGFYGASSLERLPVEIALREGTAKFKSVKVSA